MCLRTSGRTALRADSKNWLPSSCSDPSGAASSPSDGRARGLVPPPVLFPARGTSWHGACDVPGKEEECGGREGENRWVEPEEGAGSGPEGGGRGASGTQWRLAKAGE